VHGPAGAAGGVQARDVAGPVGVVEDVEQRAVDDGVVDLSPAQIHRVGDLEAGVDALDGGVVAGLRDGGRRGVDPEHVVAKAGEQDRVLPGAAAHVEHLAADPARSFEFDDRGLRRTDHPRRRPGLVDIFESGEGWCRIHAGHGSTST
jgi:hypothetical protein